MQNLHSLVETCKINLVADRVISKGTSQLIFHKCQNVVVDF